MWGTGGVYNELLPVSTSMNNKRCADAVMLISSSLWCSVGSVLPTCYRRLNTIQTLPVPWVPFLVSVGVLVNFLYV